MRLGSRLTIALAALALLAAGPANAAPTIPGPLREKLAKNPFAAVPVIVLGERGTSSSSVANSVSANSSVTRTLKRFVAVPAVAVQLTWGEVMRLSAQPGLLSITEDAPMVSSGFSNPQRWPAVSGLAKLWSDVEKAGVAPPAIAVVDTGVDASRADFGGRVVSQVTLTALPGNSPGDGSGHGTFVAGLAAGSAQLYAGAAPAAPIVSIDVADDKGMSMTSDVIGAVDWILANKTAKNIRVANFSLHSSLPSSFVSDPLAKAVERLWLSGVVVVAAAGNYASFGAPSGVRYAPANDPFVITVGAADIGSTMSASDDVAAPWSAYGYTLDGFAKPELGAPGRYLVAPVSAGARLALERPGSIVKPGYMRLSGTSFAAPLVAGAAAQLLALHPTWTPDQVKGALMASAARTNAGLALGVGELDAFTAATVQTPPNPNASLLPFLANGTFDTARWTAAAGTGLSWNTASWSSASWSSASWSSASWSSASWSSASWTSASWSSASWSSASWTSSLSELDPYPVR
jgi:serine protease AprX